jgi:curved DNA-binding protein CbpA
VTSMFLVLGIAESASEVQIDEAFRYLSKNLNPANFPSDSPASRQSTACMAKIVPAYQTVRDPNQRDLARATAIAESGRPFNPEDMKPFLGHICVAAGIISIEELGEAVSQQSDIDLPLGQILQERRLLSQTELEGLLMGQRLYGAPAKPPDPISRRLMALTAVSRDMVKIAMIDQRTNFMSSIPDLLVKRGWLDPEIFRIINEQSAKQANTLP